MEKNQLAQVVFVVPTEAAEPIANLLTEEVGGLELRDSSSEPAPAAGSTELRIWVAPSEVDARVQQVETLLASLEAMGIKAAPWTWRSEAIAPETWLEAYKLHFSPQRIGRRFLIKPSWENITPERDDLLIEMDPGMAFGTGLHATTRLVLHCLDRVLRTGPSPSSVLDLGCGTGILAIAAARLWPNAQIVAIDQDADAVAVAQENVRRNQLETRIHVEQRTVAQVDRPYYLVLANLDAETLTSSCARIRNIVDEYGKLVLCGLLAEQTEPICRMYTKDLHMEPEYSEEMDGWRALILRLRD